MKKLELREELVSKLHHHSRWYIINRIFRDYSHAISLIISLSIPTCLLLLPTLPIDEQNTLYQILLIVTLIGLILALVRTIFRFEDKTSHNKKMLDHIKEILMNYDNKFIDDKELINKLVGIDREEQEEAKR